MAINMVTLSSHRLDLVQIVEMYEIVIVEPTNWERKGPHIYRIQIRRIWKEVPKREDP